MTQSQYPADDPHASSVATEENLIRNLIKGRFADRHFSTKQILRFFEFGHLPEPLRNVSQRLAYTALDMVEILPDGPELTAGLRKLLESKDCFVRAMLPEE